MNSELHRSLLLLVGVFLMGLPCFADDEIEQLFEEGAAQSKIYDAIKRKYGDQIPEEVGLYLARQIQNDNVARSELAGNLLRNIYFSDEQRAFIPAPSSVRVRVAEIYNASSTWETDTLLFLRDYGWPSEVSLDKVAKKFMATPTHQIARTTLSNAKDPKLSDEVLHQLVDRIRDDYTDDKSVNSYEFVAISAALAREATLRHRVVKYISDVWTWSSKTKRESLGYLAWHFSSANHEGHPFSSDALYPLLHQIIRGDETSEARSVLQTVWPATTNAPDGAKKDLFRGQLRKLLKDKKASVQATAREWLTVLEMPSPKYAPEKLELSLRELGELCVTPRRSK